jgi:HPt (histidine-containing phosphotransfer) domain-containing protein
MNDDREKPVLDQAVIDGLRALEEDGAPGLLGELVELFLGDTPPRMSDMELALQTGNASGVEAAAHSLKSSCGNVGALALAELFRTIESLGREEDLATVPSLVERTKQEYGHVAQALRRELH